MSIPLRVLILEDRPSDAELSVLELRKSGFEPDWLRVETESDYLAHLDSALDLILADYSLPQFDGLRALQLLRQRELDIPFILISGTIGEDIAVEAMKQGAADYLLKDRLTRLGQAVTHTLEQKRLRVKQRRTEEEIKQKSEDLILINALNKAVNRGDSLQNIIQLLGTETKRMFACFGVTVYLLSEDKKYLVMQNLNISPATVKRIETLIGMKIPGTRIALTEQSLYWKVLQAGKPQLTNDPQIIQSFMADFTENELLRKFIPQIYRLMDINSMISIPIISESKIVGLLDVSRKELFTDSDVHRLAVISEEISAIIQRKRAEERLRLQSTALEAAANAIVITDREGAILWVNPAFTTLTGYNAEEAIGRNPRELVGSGKQDQAFYKQLWDTILAGGVWHSELINRRKDGSHYTEEETITPLKNADGKISHFIAIKQDITTRKQAEEQTQRQLQRLTALRTIDQAIAGSMDVNFVFKVILDHVISQLAVDAAVILLYNPAAQALEYATGRGFRTEALQHTRLPLGEGYAGRAALARQMVHIPDLQGRKTDFLRSPTFSQEGFVSYFGVPLIAKGEIKGVLEVFHRAAFEADTEWLNFLETLAGQTAIAIDNATLFKGLQLSTIELTMAYDATIEGWSRAMDLRDKETEGHTQRVTEMSQRLARAMGINEAELVNMRRGALLHDIGKMGVPDGILHKPGPLTDEEWVAMKKHPTFAYEMLAPISYLHAALDIPYCHHEKWDGSGYPRGLKGEEIPLVARIFAVVDVWDALTSDRPYRPAWPKEKVREHIRTSSGTHFDPQVVDVFWNMITPAISNSRDG